MTKQRALSFSVAVAAVVLSSGCIATVRGPYATASYDPNQCYWTYQDDGYGGYEQLHCWSAPSATYIAVVNDGQYVRRYPSWYRGRRIVVTAPRVRVVQPRGRVIVRPMPRVAPRGRVYVAPRGRVYVGPRR